MSLARLGLLKRDRINLAYSAASDRLRRRFSGSRLNSAFSDFTPTLNYWPYLRQREDEAHSRRRLYEQSFLGQTFRKFPNIISPRLWSSPDDPNQLMVALRFLMTLFYFHVSIGFDRQARFCWKHIETVEKIVPNEIWKVGVCNESGARETYYVLESTCEVVGSEDRLEHKAPTEGYPLRADWTTYISKRRNSLAPDSGQCQASILQNLQWSNHEEYSAGISKLWISRVEKERDVGVYKLVVAQRYVLACVVGNRYDFLHSFRCRSFLTAQFVVSVGDRCPRRRWKESSKVTLW